MKSINTDASLRNDVRVIVETEATYGGRTTKVNYDNRSLHDDLRNLAALIDVTIMSHVTWETVGSKSGAERSVGSKRVELSSRKTG